MINFYYKGNFIGSCDPDFMDCPELLDLIENDERAFQDVLDYMNSLGDPVFPAADGRAETDIDNVDSLELYNTFMRELGYEYSDFPDQFGVDANGVEVWSSADVVASTNIDATLHTWEYLTDTGLGVGERGDRFTLTELEDIYDGLWQNGDPSAVNAKNFDDWLEGAIRSKLLKPAEVAATTNIDAAVSLGLTQGYSKDEIITEVNALATALARKGNIDYDEILAYIRDAKRWLDDAEEGDSYFMAGRSFLYNPDRDCDEYVECARKVKPRYFANMVSGVTEDFVDDESLQLFKQYQLDEFYNSSDNVAIIPDKHFTDTRLWKWITQFMVDNETWNMCHQGWGRDDGCWVIYEG